MPQNETRRDEIEMEMETKTLKLKLQLQLPGWRLQSEDCLRNGFISDVAALSPSPSLSVSLFSADTINCEFVHFMKQFKSFSGFRTCVSVCVCEVWHAARVLALISNCRQGEKGRHHN